jgi:hypothetical protein
VTRWFERLPIHRKLVASALLITAVALTVAMLGLSVLDIWRYRVNAIEDARALASIVAERRGSGDSPECARPGRGDARLCVLVERPALRRLCSDRDGLPAQCSRA